MLVSDLHDFLSNINVLTEYRQKKWWKDVVGKFQNTVDEDPKFHNISKEYELQLWKDLATYCTMLRSSTHLTHKGAAKDVLATVLFVHEEVS